MENDPKYTAKSTQEFSKAKNWIFFSDLDSHLISTQQSCFSVTEDKTEGRETQKWAATEGGCSKGLTEHLNRGNTVFDDVYFY